MKSMKRFFVLLLTILLMPFVPVKAEAPVLTSACAILVDLSSGTVLLESNSSVQIASGVYTDSLVTMMSLENGNPDLLYRTMYSDTKALDELKKSIAEKEDEQKQKMDEFISVYNISDTSFAEGKTNLLDVATLYMNFLSDPQFKQIFSSYKYTLSDKKELTRESKFDKELAVTGEKAETGEKSQSVIAVSEIEGNQLMAIVYTDRGIDEACKDIANLFAYGAEVSRKLVISGERIGIRYVTVETSSTVYTVQFSYPGNVSISFPPEADEKHLDIQIEVLDETDPAAMRAYAVFRYKGEEFSRLPMEKVIKEEPKDLKGIWLNRVKKGYQYVSIAVLAWFVLRKAVNMMKKFSPNR